MTSLFLIMKLAGEKVAVSASDVESVIEVETITRVPRAACHVAGIAALRSRVLTVIDGRVSLGLGTSFPKKVNEAIVVEADGHPYALLVDAIEGVFEHSGEIAPLHTEFRGGWRRIARGMIDRGDELLLLIDAEALIVGPSRHAA